jgi:SnoaL-like domain
MSDWVNAYYDDVDHMRLDEWLARHTDDVVVRFGNNPPARGKEEVGGNIGGFWSMIGGLKHTILRSYEVDGTTILEADVDYTRKDGNHVVVPCTTFLHREGDLVDELRVYIDLAPVFAEAAAA